MLQRNDSVFAETISLNIQYIPFGLEENVVHRCSKPKNPSKAPNPGWIEPPTGIPCRHRRQEKAAPQLHTGDNMNKS
jgi:hypothetical protein